MTKPSIRRIFAGLCFAVLGGVLLPLELSFATSLLVTPILTALLYAWAGAIPPLALGVLSMLVCRFIGGDILMLGGLLALILPGFASVALLRQRLPFFRALLRSAVIQVGLMAIALVLCRMLAGEDLIALLISGIRSSINMLPETLVSEVLMQMGRAQVFSRSGVDFTVGILSTQDMQTLIDQTLASIEITMLLNLPSMLICSGVTTGLLSYAVPARLCVRRGDEPPLDYVPLAQWRLPSSIIIGLPLSTLSAYIAFRNGVGGADSVYIALFNLSSLAFVIQALGALQRRMRLLGMPRGRGTFMCILMLLFAQWMMALAGVFSALFGSRGLIREWIKKHNANNSGGDDWP